MMIYHAQSDPNWGENSMFLKNDRIKDLGCLLAAGSNIIQNLLNRRFTPDIANRLCIEKNLYWGNNYPGEESKLYTEKFFNLFKFKYKQNIGIRKQLNPENQYIAKIIFRGYGHFVNLITINQDNCICYNVYNNKLEIYKKDDMIRIDEVRS